MRLHRWIAEDAPCDVCLEISPGGECMRVLSQQRRNRNTIIQVHRGVGYTQPVTVRKGMQLEVIGAVDWDLDA